MTLIHSGMSAFSRFRGGWTGHPHQTAHGLVAMGPRFYDPAAGRFIQPDPTTPDPADPHDWGRYTYTRNNPMFYSDPSGSSPQPDPFETTPSIAAEQEAMSCSNCVGLQGLADLISITVTGASAQEVVEQAGIIANALANPTNWARAEHRIQQEANLWRRGIRTSLGQQLFGDNPYLPTQESLAEALLRYEDVREARVGLRSPADRAEARLMTMQMTEAGQVQLLGVGGAVRVGMSIFGRTLARQAARSGWQLSARRFLFQPRSGALAVFRGRPVTTARADTRTPFKVQGGTTDFRGGLFERGFQARGSIYKPLRYAYGDAGRIPGNSNPAVTRGLIIGTARTPNIAMDFARRYSRMMGGLPVGVYEIVAPKGLYINRVLGSRSPMPWQNEVIFKGRIANHYIRAFHSPSLPHAIENPFYRPWTGPPRYGNGFLRF